MLSFDQAVRLAQVRGGRIRLPEDFLSQLELASGSYVVISSRNKELVIEKVTRFKVIKGGKKDN